MQQKLGPFGLQIGDTKILIDQTLIDALTMKLWSLFMVNKKFLVKIIPHFNDLTFNRQWGFIIYGGY